MSPGENARAAGIRIAVLERHRLVGEAMGSALSTAGFDVPLVTSRWNELLALPEGEVDVAVLDLHLDDGVLGATRVNDLNSRGIATVIVGTAADTATVAGAVRAGALGFVSTSSGFGELTSAVLDAAAGRRRVDAVPSALPVDPGLGRQEERALVLYATGRSIREVAHDMRTTEETVKSYIKRGRRKYREVGVDVGTKVLLRAHATREGWHSRR